MKRIGRGLTFVVGGLMALGFGPLARAPIPVTAVELTAPIIARSTAQIPTISINKLPPEAKTTIQLIRQGGPFPYKKDGTIFGNREGRLPSEARGYYREYTVPTPGVATRGARRIVTGKRSEFYYTGDHYRSFFRVK